MRPVAKEIRNLRLNKLFVDTDSYAKMTNNKIHLSLISKDLKVQVYKPHFDYYW